MGRVSHGWWVRIATGLLLLTAISVIVSACAPQRGAVALGANAAGAQRSLSALAPLTTTTPTTPVTTVTTTVTPSVTPSVTPVIPAAGSDPTVPPPVVSAAAAELYDATTGKTLYALSPDASVPMASTTKIMTAVVALTYGKLDQPITVGPDAVAIENGGTSVAGLRLGETLSLREMLYCLMLPSGDDAAIAIADGIGGSESGFVALMNLEAGLLGLSHTHYANPHGLDAPEHFTSVSDLVRLADFAMNSPTFAQVVAAPSITLPATATHHEFQLLNT
ncbi:MAG TPA: hypothetical protein VE338_05270, partial [Ktedonobacterales bacterium]|nr:hypothetical protein [Ktedonobacterales bacterium]